ncbi:TIGR03571 family LLM class oxidoreductase [Halorubrum vacuolatum]|uniref:Luciferase-type oxidoreductase, BA3436 family n=1 Tax=Halorubrum vacuolatum TaxID=63740 RepID=A0A238USX3_HALVU|nr:TIGR03571 family LLM class oxidoreductase [Halorubrum vacuolatum]SNR25138.1 luciferase-type oxidoreductase, BA3436 family [Halorubrum vacuolatum]
MTEPITSERFNVGFERCFEGDALTVGLGLPLTGVRRDTAPVAAELHLATRAEALGFDALWIRDVPTYWPRFGDAGGGLAPWPLLGALAAHTDEVALGTSSVVLPLRHPIHVAASAATVDRISAGRLVLGVASGDREPEYAAFDVDPAERGAAVRESMEAIRACWRGSFPDVTGRWGSLDGELDVLPKPHAGTIPLLPTGNARQSREWIAEHGDGWLFYHLPESTLESYLDSWRALAGEKPFVIAVRVAFADDPEAEPEPLHLGYRAGVEWFRGYFDRLEAMGLDHVIVGLEGDDPEAAMATFADAILADR